MGLRRAGGGDPWTPAGASHGVRIVRSGPARNGDEESPRKRMRSRGVTGSGLRGDLHQKSVDRGLQAARRVGELAGRAEHLLGRAAASPIAMVTVETLFATTSVICRT